MSGLNKSTTKTTLLKPYQPYLQPLGGPNPARPVGRLRPPFLR